MFCMTGSVLGQTWETKTEKRTSGTSYSLPSGTYQITKFQAWGGGGGGATNDNRELAAGGGGGGGYAEYSTNISAHKGQSVSYSIGAGGGPGATGGSSSVTFGGTNYITAYGGGGGSQGRDGSGYAAGGTGGGHTGVSGYTGYYGGNGGRGHRGNSGQTGWRMHVSGGGGGSGAGSSGNGNGGTDGESHYRGLWDGWGVRHTPAGGGSKSEGGGAGGHGGHCDQASSLSGGNFSSASSGSAYGGGGGGGAKRYTGNENNTGGSGAAGAVWITYKTLKLSVLFNQNTTDAVSNMPSDATIWYYDQYNTITISSIPTRSNYLFQGWYLDAACTQALDGNAICDKTADFTLYAKWEEITAPDMFSKAENYMACQGEVIKIEVEGLPAGYTYAVYTQPTGGTYSYSSDPTFFLKTDNSDEVAYVQAISNGTSVGDRIEVPVLASAFCGGSTTDQSCSGTRLYN